MDIPCDTLRRAYRTKTNKRRREKKRRKTRRVVRNPKLYVVGTSSLKVPVVKSRVVVCVGVRKKNAPQQQICVMNARVVVESHAPFAAHDGHMRLSSTHVVVTEDDFDDDRSE